VASYFLKLAGAVAGTVGTIYRVRGHKKLKTSACQRYCSFGIDHHAFTYLFGAGSNRLLPALYLDEAQTAGSHWLGIIPNGTQVGDVDTVVQRYPQELVSGMAGDSLTIDD
jgi:hypothetical protein